MSEQEYNPNPINLAVALVVLMLPATLFHFECFISGMLLGIILLGHAVRSQMSGIEPKTPPPEIPKALQVIESFFKFILSPYIALLNRWDHIIQKDVGSLIPEPTQFSAYLFYNLPMVVIWLTHLLLPILMVNGFMTVSTSFYPETDVYLQLLAFNSSFEQFYQTALMFLPMMIWGLESLRRYNINRNLTPLLIANMFGFAPVLVIHILNRDISLEELNQLIWLTSLLSTLLTAVFYFIWKKIRQNKGIEIGNLISAKTLLLSAPFVFVATTYLSGSVFAITSSLQRITTTIAEVPFSDGSFWCGYDLDPVRIQIIDGCLYEHYLSESSEETLRSSHKLAPENLEDKFALVDFSYVHAKRGFFSGLNSLYHVNKDMSLEQLPAYFKLIHDMTVEFHDKHRPEKDDDRLYVTNLRTLDADLEHLKLAAQGEYKKFWAAYLGVIQEIHRSVEEQIAENDGGAWFFTRLAGEALIANGIKPAFSIPTMHKIKRSADYLLRQAEFDRIPEIDQIIKTNPLPPMMTERRLFSPY